MAVVYKVTGQTRKGKCACGHRVKRNEPYYIKRDRNLLRTYCPKCIGRCTFQVIDANNVINLA